MIDAETAAKYLAIATAIGAALPFVQALIQQPQWSPKVKAVLTVILSIVAALVAYVVKNGFNFGDPLELTAWVIGIFAAAATSYSRIWRPTDLAPKLERATAPTPEAAVEPAQLVPAGSVVDAGGHPTGAVEDVDQNNEETEEELLATDGTEHYDFDAPIPTDFDDGRDPKYRGQ